MSMDERKKEAELSQTISSLAKQMINNADVVLRTEKLVAEGKLENSNIEKLIRMRQMHHYTEQEMQWLRDKVGNCNLCRTCDTVCRLFWTLRYSIIAEK